MVEARRDTRPTSVTHTAGRRAEPDAPELEIDIAKLTAPLT